MVYSGKNIGAHVFISICTSTNDPSQDWCTSSKWERKEYGWSFLSFLYVDNYHKLIPRCMSICCINILMLFFFFIRRPHRGRDGRRPKHARSLEGARLGLFADACVVARDSVVLA